MQISSNEKTIILILQDFGIPMESTRALGEHAFMYEWLYTLIKVLAISSEKWYQYSYQGN